MARKEHWHPAPLPDKATHRAVQALAQGDAGPEDQKRAIRWIIEEAAMTYDEPFRPGMPDAVNYVLGRRSVGLAIVKCINTRINIGTGDNEQ